MKPSRLPTIDRRLFADARHRGNGRIRSALLAAAIGIGLTLALAHWWST
jgi:hypothetical protein